MKYIGFMKWGKSTLSLTNRTDNNRFRSNGDREVEVCLLEILRNLPSGYKLFFFNQSTEGEPIRRNLEQDYRLYIIDTYELEKYISILDKLVIFMGPETTKMAKYQEKIMRKHRDLECICVSTDAMYVKYDFLTNAKYYMNILFEHNKLNSLKLTFAAPCDYLVDFNQYDVIRHNSTNVYTNLLVVCNQVNKEHNRKHRILELTKAPCDIYGKWDEDCGLNVIRELESYKDFWSIISKYKYGVIINTQFEEYKSNLEYLGGVENYLPQKYFEFAIAGVLTFVDVRESIDYKFRKELDKILPSELFIKDKEDMYSIIDRCERDSFYYKYLIDLQDSFIDTLYENREDLFEEFLKDVL